MPSLSLEGRRVYLACGATDMRKSIDGLAAIVEEDFELDPSEGALFVFCNRQRNRVKVLEWDENGFWLHLKRFESGRIRWPQSASEDPVALTGEELGHLLESTKLERKIRAPRAGARRAALSREASAPAPAREPERVPTLASLSLERLAESPFLSW